MVSSCARAIKAALELIKHRQFGFDRVDLAIDTPSPDLPWRELEQHCRRVKSGNQSNRFQRVYPFYLALLQPDRAALRLLAESVMGRYSVQIHGIEVTCDFITRTERDALRVGAWLLGAVRAPYFRHDVEAFSGSTFYWAPATTGTLKSDDDPGESISKKERSKTARNLVLYLDRASKLAGPHVGKPCAHIEFRLRGQETLRANGLSTLKDIADFDHRSFWRKAVGLHAFPSKAALARWLEPTNVLVSQTALTKRANAYLSDMATKGIFVLQNALRAEPSLRQTLLDIDPALLFGDKDAKN